jgi:hypothetical protein
MSGGPEADFYAIYGRSSRGNGGARLLESPKSCTEVVGHYGRALPFFWPMNACMALIAPTFGRVAENDSP